MKKKYQYKCTLLSDIILTSMASTEGYKESLNYIPGAKFLGIASKQLYDVGKPEATLDIFHNGTVRFGDATPIVGDAAALKIPFSWFYKKGDKLSDTVYLHHNLKEGGASSQLQLKQARDGFFSLKDNAFVSVDQSFSLKSAYDMDKRRSKDSQMFGYFSLKKGTSWTFCVSDASGLYADDIKNALLGKHSVGKSKSAEYGLMDITGGEEIKETSLVLDTKEVLIYAQSNLCFYDNFGKCTAKPTVEQLVGTKNATIDWAKSQVRTRNYQTWNRKRNNRDTDRLIIESGSVFFVKLEENAQTGFFTEGVGSHRNEGFGVVQVNPTFLVSTTEKLSLGLTKQNLTTQQFYAFEGDAAKDKVTLDWLKNKQTRDSFEGSIDELVNQFVKNRGDDFKGLTKSQWGSLRNYAKNALSKAMFIPLVFDPNSGFLYRGKSESEWRKNGRRVKLEAYLEGLSADKYLPFVVKLSNLMAKSE